MSQFKSWEHCEISNYLNLGLLIVEGYLRKETLLNSAVIQQNKLPDSIKGITSQGSFERA